MDKHKLKKVAQGDNSKKAYNDLLNFVVALADKEEELDKKRQKNTDPERKTKKQSESYAASQKFGNIGCNAGKHNA